MSKSDFEILRRQSEERAAEGRERSPAWNFKKEPVFEGTVVRGKVVHANDKATPILVADQYPGDKRYTIWCGNFMLERAIADLSPAVGALIVVEFLGLEPTANDPSRSFNNYSIACSKSDPEYWGELWQAYRSKSDAGAEAAQHGETPTTFGPDEAPFSGAHVA